MAEPKLQIEKRLDRVEKAISTLAKKTHGKSMQKKIEKILRGEHVEERDD